MSASSARQQAVRRIRRGVQTSRCGVPTSGSPAGNTAAPAAAATAPVAATAAGTGHHPARDASPAATVTAARTWLGGRHRAQRRAVARPEPAM